MLTKPPFFPAARPRKAAKSGYSTDSTTYGVQQVSRKSGGRECTDPEIQPILSAQPPPAEAAVLICAAVARAAARPVSGGVRGSSVRPGRCRLPR